MSNNASYAYVSIHAPVKGATGNPVDFLFYNDSFNPRTREGCDNQRQGCAREPLAVSIHAPVKGATVKCHVKDGKTVLVSIHAPVKGATYNVAIN